MSGHVLTCDAFGSGLIRPGVIVRTDSMNKDSGKFLDLAEAYAQVTDDTSMRRGGQPGCHIGRVRTLRTSGK